MVGARNGDGALAAPVPFRMKGVGWSPMPVGETNTSGYTLHYSSYADQDVPLMAALNANTIKTYNAFELNPSGLALLDQLQQRGLMVVMTVMPSYWDAQNKAYLDAVEAFKGHPAVLMWLLGNELNYNKLYNSALSLEQAVELVRVAIDDIHAADPDHPVAVSWGNAPDAAVLATLGAADVWALNIYPYLSMTERFDEWAARSNKPMFLGEYGADAWNADTGAEDAAGQAHATEVLTQQIQADYSAVHPGRPVIGGCIFEFADEWHKALGTSASSQEAGGFDNSGVYPDGVSNEEWWGLVSVDREPRQSYTTLQQLYAP
jgi:beta-galactosidase/beta-glucuronidase